MSKALLKLHFSQLTNIWKASRDNNYADADKQVYQDKLSKLYDFLQAENIDSLEENEIIERKKIIDFCIKSLEFLNTSTLNQIPFETIQCIRVALKDWVDPREYIAATSLSNHFDRFAFDPSLTENAPLYDLVEKITGITFDKKLLQIILPRNLAHDYLSNVILYHELAHFIDNELHITDPIYRDLCIRIPRDEIKEEELTQLKQWFPYLEDLNRIKKVLEIYEGDFLGFKHHLREYFADVFAAQYIEDTSSKYLRYLVDLPHKSQATHPSPNLRKRLVNDFLNLSENYLIDLINKSCESLGKESLRKRYVSVDAEDFYKLLPIPVNDERQLHYLYKLAWDIWITGPEKMEESNDMCFKLSDPQFYQIVNNLVEKSIGNYIIQKNWIEHSHVSEQK